MSNKMRAVMVTIVLVFVGAACCIDKGGSAGDTSFQVNLGTGAIRLGAGGTDPNWIIFGNRFEDMTETIPCPENRPGCLVLHYADKTNDEPEYVEAAYTFDELLDAIEWVESRGDPNAKGDRLKLSEHTKLEMAEIMTKGTLSGCKIGGEYFIKKVSEDLFEQVEYRAIGAYQITKIYVDDVNRILRKWKAELGEQIKKSGGKGLGGWFVPYTYDDRWDRNYSREMANIYLTYYTPGYESDADYWEKAARIHNGGPDGWKKESTSLYWEKIRARMLDRRILAISKEIDFDIDTTTADSLLITQFGDGEAISIAFDPNLIIAYQQGNIQDVEYTITRQYAEMQFVINTSCNWFKLDVGTPDLFDQWRSGIVCDEMVEVEIISDGVAKHFSFDEFLGLLGFGEEADKINNRCDVEGIIEERDDGFYACVDYEWVIISDKLTIEWMMSPNDPDNPGSVELGFRSDGIVVWRDMDEEGAERCGL